MNHTPFSAIQTSPEFVSLCQTQIKVLQGLGAVWSAVYLMERRESSPHLIPIVVDPNNTTIWQAEYQSNGLGNKKQPSLLSFNLSLENIPPWTQRGVSEGELTLTRRQLVFPLLQEDQVIGVLVTRRDDRDWTEQELSLVEYTAQTVSIGHLLAEKNYWLQQEYHQQAQGVQNQFDRLDTFFHQLRNPLTAIRTFTQVLLKRLLPEDKNYNTAQSILRESQRMQDLIQQFEDQNTALKPSLLQTDSSLILTSLPPSTSSFLLPGTDLLPLDLKHILLPILENSKTLAETKEIRFLSDIPKDIPLIKGNEKALQEVVINLLDNALKYTPKGGTVQLSLQSENNHHINLIIQDTGYGIPPEDQINLFQRHFRGKQAKGNIPGTGLGLAIVKELMEQMSATIECISPNHWLNAEQGTTFKLSLSLWNGLC